MDKLTITIYSFGYKKSGIPPDKAGNGGGYVFDCRCLPNPGREERFKDKIGLDEEVIDYLDDIPGIDDFLHAAFSLIDKHAKNYTDRGFTDLMVAFGCTGGQHRSVYCAEKIATRLENAGYKTKVVHTDLAEG
jgi:RNase adaptor protein for sRNA GlmZ degradation